MLMFYLNFIFINGRTKYYDLMAKKLLLTLVIFAFCNYGIAKPSEERRSQGITHESVALVKEEGKWKTLKDGNGGSGQRSNELGLPGFLDSGFCRF